MSDELLVLTLSHLRNTDPLQTTLQLLPICGRFHSIARPLFRAQIRIDDEKLEPFLWIFKANAARFQHTLSLTVAFAHNYRSRRQMQVELHSARLHQRRG